MSILYIYNKFIPNLFIGYKTFFYQIIRNNVSIRNWEHIRVLLEENPQLGNSELYFYCNHLNNYQETIISNFGSQLDNYMYNLYDIYLYQEIKEYILNLNDMLLFINTYNHIYQLDFEQINTDLRFDNISDHIQYLLIIGDFIFNFILNNLYDYYNFQLQSDLNEMRMYQLPILNKNNIKSRNIVLKDHLSVDFIFNINIEYDIIMKINKECLYSNFKINCKKLSKIIDKCIDLLYKGYILSKSFIIDIQLPRDLEILNEESHIPTLMNMTRTPTKSPINQLKIVRNLLSSVKKTNHNIQSPYKKTFSMRIQNIDIDNYINTKKSARKLDLNSLEPSGNF